MLTKDDAASAFGPDGEVYVVKRFAFGGASFTITTFDGQVFGPFTDNEVFEEGAHGDGFEARLIECTFTEGFSDMFVLVEETANFFGIPPLYVGTEVTSAGSADGTAWVIAPGR